MPCFYFIHNSVCLKHPKPTRELHLEENNLALLCNSEYFNGCTIPDKLWMERLQMETLSQEKNSFPLLHFFQCVANFSNFSSFILIFFVNKCVVFLSWLYLMQHLCFCCYVYFDFLFRSFLFALDTSFISYFVLGSINCSPRN